MTPEQLLKELEPVTYRGRMQRMVELGRQAAQDKSIQATLQSLSKGDVYQRDLALHACFGSRDAIAVQQALLDPSRGVRASALNLVPLLCTDSQILEILATVSADIRKAIMIRLLSRKRQAVLDTYIEQCVQRQDPALPEFFALASHALVVQYLQPASEKFTLVSWQRLARHHPDLVVEHVQARAATLNAPDQRFLLQVNAVLPILTEAVPDQAVQLVASLTSLVPLQKLSLQALAQKRPVEIVDMLLATDEKAPFRLGRNALSRLDTARLITLFTRYPQAANLQHLSRLTPPQRVALYTACGRSWHNADGIINTDIIAHLPTQQRTDEARRHLQLPALITRPVERLNYVAFLPWDEALTAIQSTLNVPDAALRGASLSAIIASVRYNRSSLPQALQFITRRRYEQDPVRVAMLEALAKLPPGIWQVEHLSTLAQVIEDALNAKDLSFATARYVETLIVQLLPSHTDWAALQLAHVYRVRGMVNVYDLDQYLNNTNTRKLVPALSPLLQEWQKIEREGQLVRLAQALGRRMRVMPELADTLEKMLEHTRQASFVTSILNIFHEYQRTRIHTVIPALLAQDQSCITLEPVYSYLHKHRQDLLNPYLGQYAHKGRFSTGKTRLILPVSDGFYRWTPRQQDTFAQTLQEIIRDKQRATHEVVSVMNKLAQMPAIDVRYLTQFARDERPAVRDVVLTVLGKLDAGQGIPTLLEALTDERARTAIYVLRSALLEMSKGAALTILRTVPFTQVTVAKEVVRLIGELEGEEAWRELLNINTRELHRDVRVALLRALWPYGEYDETWTIFEQAATASDSALAKGVIAIPVDGMSERASTRLTALMVTLLTNPDPTVRMDTLQRCRSHPVSDSESLLYGRLLILIRSTLPDEVERAANVVFSLYSGSGGADDSERVGSLIASLLPERRILHIVMNQYLTVLWHERQRRLPTTRAILTALSGDPLTLSLRIQLIFVGLPWSEVVTELVSLTLTLHARAYQTATSSLHQAAQRPDADLNAFEQKLANSEDERLRSLALTALLAQARSQGWTDEIVARLHVYRQDSSPLVAELAQFTFPA